MNKKIFMTIIMFLVVISIANAGVTMPSPTQLELKPGGEAGEFRFGIENPGNDVIECSYGFKEEFGLPVEWSKEKAVVEAGAKTFIYGLVTVPVDAEPGIYSSKIAVNCGGVPTLPTGGATITMVYDNLPISVNVVGERTRGNPYDPVEEEKPKTVPLTTFAIYLILLVIILYLFTNLFKKKK